MMEQGGRPCHIDLPYPQVTPGRDPLAVCLLMEDYSGAASELSAVHQYIYAAAQLKGKCDPVSQLLRQVAIVEMHHLELLAQAVLAKGGDPRYVMRGGRKPERFLERRRHCIWQGGREHPIGEHPGGAGSHRPVPAAHPAAGG